MHIDNYNDTSDFCCRTYQNLNVQLVIVDSLQVQTWVAHNENEHDKPLDYPYAIFYGLLWSNIMPFGCPKCSALKLAIFDTIDWKSISSLYMPVCHLEWFLLWQCLNTATPVSSWVWFSTATPVSAGYAMVLRQRVCFYIVANISAEINKYVTSVFPTSMWNHDDDFCSFSPYFSL